MIGDRANQSEIFAEVSVIIPCYRCLATIERAVASVFSQKLLPKELLLVEDFSCDDGETLNLLYQIQKSNQGKVDIKVIQLLTNRGPGEARNAGWNIATQPYIAFLDADDVWDSEKLKIQFAFMQKNTDVAITGHNYTILNAENAIKYTLPKGNLSTIKVNSLSFLFKNQFPTSSVMIKRSIEFRFATGKRAAEDTRLWQEVSFSGLSIFRINVPLVYYYKALYGHGGLSKDLWKMEKAELDNYFNLFKMKSIGLMLLICAINFSLVKYIRRVLISFMRS